MRLAGRRIGPWVAGLVERTRVSALAPDIGQAYALPVDLRGRAQLRQAALGAAAQGHEAYAATIRDSGDEKRDCRLARNP